MAKYPEWEYALLRYLGAPEVLTDAGMEKQYPNALLALNLWAQSEGSVTNNPLATSGMGAGATKCVAQCGSSSPIYEYDNVADGVAQMGRFLQGSYYTKIVSALLANDTLSAIFNAMNSSPWCKGCQSGQYPVDLSKQVNGQSQGISGTVGTGGSGTGTGGSAGSGGGGGANAKGSDLSACVVQFPGLLFFSGPCILTKGGVKWLSGAACIVAGGVLATFGVVLLASAVGQSTGATDAVKKGAKAAGIGASLFAGQPEVAAGIASTSKGSARRAPAKAPAAVPKAPPLTPIEKQQKAEVERSTRDVAATYRPNNRGLSRESTHKQRDFAAAKRQANAKAKAANF